MQISLFVFGIYLLATGAFLFVAPDLAFNLLGFPPTGEDWVRVAGLLAGLLGFYFILLREHAEFARVTIYDTRGYSSSSVSSFLS